MAKRRRRRRAPTRRRRRSYAKPARRRRSSGGSKGRLSGKAKLNVAMGGAAYGYIIKEGWLENVPFIKDQSGAKKTAFAALGLHYLAKNMKSKEIDHVATAAAAIAGYQFGESGFKMSGEGEWDSIDGGEIGADEIDLD